MTKCLRTTLTSEFPPLQDEAFEGVERHECGRSRSIGIENPDHELRTLPLEFLCQVLGRAPHAASTRRPSRG
jgi:hypothetical protein